MTGDGLPYYSATPVEVLDPNGAVSEDHHHRISRCLGRHLGLRSWLLHVWQSLVILSVIIEVIVNSFLWAFSSDVQKDLWCVVYLMDGMFIIYIVSKFFLDYDHRHGVPLTDSRLVRRRYLKTTFILDIISIIPIEMFGFASLSSMKYVALLRSNRLLRLNVVFRYFRTVESRLRTNSKRLQVLKYLIIIGLVFHLMACAWFAFGCPGNHHGLDSNCYSESWAAVFDFERRNMTFNFEHDTDIGTMTTSRSYTLSLYWAVTTASSTGYGDIRPITIGEKWFVIVSMLVGFGLLLGLVLSGMASRLINWDSERAHCSHYLDVTKTNLQNSGVPQEMVDLVVKYQKYSWFCNNGVSDGSLINKLPIPLHADVSYSANRIILEKTTIFEDLNPGFLRMVSMKLKQTLYLPGQLLVARNNNTTSMYYVQRGQLLLMDSTDMSADTMTPGTLFGEVDLIKNVTHTNDILTLTYCDLMELKRADLNNIVAHYSGIDRVLAVRAQTRQDTRQSAVAQTASTCVDMTIHIEDTDDQSHEIAVIPHVTSAEGTVPLPPDITSEEEAGCLHRFHKGIADHLTNLKTFDWYFMPDGKLIKFWEYLVLLVTISVGFIYPYVISFLGNQQNENVIVRQPILALFFTLDFIIIADIFVRLRIAHVTPNGTFKNFKSIRENYIQSRAFLLDVLAAIPLYIFSLHLPMGLMRTNLVYLLSLNRLVKVWRLKNFFAKKEKDLDVSLGLVRLSKFTIYMVLFTHWNVCLWYYGLQDQGPDDIYDNTGYDNHTFEDSSIMEYLNALYWTMITMTNTGYGDIVPRSLMTYLITIYVEIGGLVAFGYILSYSTSVMRNQDCYRVKCVDKMQVVNTYMKDHNVSAKTQQHVINENIASFKKNKGFHTSGKRLMHDIPTSFQQDIAFYQSKELFQEVPLFKDCNEKFLQQVALKTYSYTYSPGDKIISYGDRRREIYLIKDGHCEVLSRGESKVITRLGPGNFFGSHCFTFGGEHKATVLAVSNVNLLMLRRCDMDEVLKVFPLMQQQFSEIVESNEIFKNELHLAISREEQTAAADDTLEAACDMDDEGHTVSLYPVTNKKPRSLKFFDELSDSDKEIFDEPYQKLGYFARFMTNFLQKMAVIPEGFNAKFWEGCRVLIAVAMGFFYLFQAAFLHENPHLWLIVYLLDFVCVIDIYYRFHWAYYDKKDVLITHPVATARKYLKSTFLLDVIACFPHELIVYGVMGSWSSEAIHMIAVLRFNRLLQLYRVPLYFNNMEMNLKYSAGIVKTFKFSFYLVIVFHTLACVWFIQACPPVGFTGVAETTLAQEGLISSGHHYCSNNSWTSRFDNFADKTPLEMYVVSLYWASSTGALVGYGDIVASLDKPTEMLTAIFATIVGIVFFRYLMASLAAGMANAESRRASYREKLASVARHMEDHNVEKSLKDRVLKHYQYTWQQTKGIDPDAWFDELNPSTKADVSMEMYKQILKQVPMFQGTGDSFIKSLASYIKPAYFTGNEYVVKKFDLQEQIFFINHGLVDVISEDGRTVFNTVTFGECFGEISLMMSNCQTTMSIRTQTNCELLTLDKDDLGKVFADFPNIKMQILAAEEHQCCVVNAEVQIQESEVSLLATATAASAASSSFQIPQIEECRPGAASPGIQKQESTVSSSATEAAAISPAAADGIYIPPATPLPSSKHRPYTANVEIQKQESTVSLSATEALTAEECQPRAASSGIQKGESTVSLCPTEAVAAEECQPRAASSGIQKGESTVSLCATEAAAKSPAAAHGTHIPPLPPSKRQPSSVNVEIQKRESTVSLSATEAVAAEECQPRAASSGIQKRESTVSLCPTEAAAISPAAAHGIPPTPPLPPSKRQPSSVNVEIQKRESTVSFCATEAAAISPAAAHGIPPVPPLPPSKRQPSSDSVEIQKRESTMSLAVYSMFIPQASPLPSSIRQPSAGSIEIQKGRSDVSSFTSAAAGVSSAVNIGTAGQSPSSAAAVAVDIPSSSGAARQSKRRATPPWRGGWLPASRSPSLSPPDSPVIPPTLLTATAEIHTEPNNHPVAWDMLLPLRNNRRSDDDLSTGNDVSNVNGATAGRIPQTPSKKESFIIDMDAQPLGTSKVEKSGLAVAGAIPHTTSQRETCAIDMDQQPPVAPMASEGEEMVSIFQQFLGSRIMVKPVTEQNANHEKDKNESAKPDNNTSANEARSKLNVDQTKLTTDRTNKTTGDGSRSGNSNNNASEDNKIEIETEQAAAETSILHRLLAANRVVIEPDNFHLRILSVITCVLIVVTCMMILFQTAFQYESASIVSLTYLCELVFVFEIFIKFHVTRADKHGELEMDFDKVYKIYLKNPAGFAVDLFPTIPFEIIALFFSGKCRFVMFTHLRLTRLVRLIRVKQFFSKWEKQLDIDMLKVCIMKMFVFVLLTIYTCGCVWYIIACPSGVCRERSWADHQGYLSNDTVVSPSERFTDAIYWSASTLSSTGVGDISAHTYAEMLFASLIMILGQLVVGTVVAHIISALVNKDARRVKYEKGLQKLKGQLNGKKVDAKLKDSVVDYLDYVWQRNKCVDLLEQYQDLPFCMRAELILHIYGDHLRRLRLFANCSEPFFREISLYLREVIVRPGDNIVNSDDIGNEMYIIYRGQAKVISENDPYTTECTLKEGDYFNDINLLYNLPCSRTIRAVTYVDAVTLSMLDLKKVMERFPEDAKKIQETGLSLFPKTASAVSYMERTAAAAVSSTKSAIIC